MRFLEQAKSGRGNAGTYMLTIAIAFLSLVIGQVFVELIANKLLGYSLINIPDTADLNLALSLLLLPFSFLLISLLICAKYLHHRKILSLFTSRNSFDWKRFIFSFMTWGVMLTASLGLAISTGSPIELNIDFSKFIPLILVSIFIIPIQTSAEEVLFRGYLFQGFGTVFKKAWVPILITGILFGLLHWANPEVAKVGDILLLFYIWTGVFLGIMTHMDNGIELSMGYHAVNNIFAALIVTNEWQAFQTDAVFIDMSEPQFGWEMWITLFVLQPVMLLLFSKKYHWGSWKQKIID